MRTALLSLLMFFALEAFSKDNPNILLSDSFEDDNDTLLENHAMHIGPGWVKKATSASIQSDKVQADEVMSGQADAWYMADGGVHADRGTLTVKLDLAKTHDRQINLYLGQDASNQGWLLMTEPWIDEDANNGNVKLYENSGNGNQLVHHLDHTFSGGDQIWKVFMSGGIIRFLVDDEVIFQYNSNNRYGTKWGFELYGNPAEVAGTVLDGFILIK